jgi:uncharacterized membrane protein YkoI
MPSRYRRSRADNRATNQRKEPMNRKLTAALAVALGIAASGAACAHEEERDSAVLSQAQISMTQAIAAAEQHTKGRAVRAALENENGTAVYGVEVLDGAKAMDVKVDARDGSVLRVQDDSRDREEHEHDDGD